jgi:hypothetical protein
VTQRSSASIAIAYALPVTDAGNQLLLLLSAGARPLGTA